MEARCLNSSRIQSSREACSSSASTLLHLRTRHHRADGKHGSKFAALCMASAVALPWNNDGSSNQQNTPPDWVKRKLNAPKQLDARLQKAISGLETSIEQASLTGDSKLAAYLQRVLDHKQQQRKKCQKSSTFSTHQVAQAVLSLSTTLDIPLESAISLTSKCDRLTAIRPALIRSSLTALSTTLQCTPSETLGLVSRNPAILLTTASVIHTHIPALLSLLKVSPRQLYFILQQRPELVTQSPVTLSKKTMRLGELLGITPDAATKLVASCPRVLRSSTSTMQLKHQALQKVLGLPPALASELVVKEPRVLCVSSQVLGQQLERLLFKFALFQDEVVDMVLADPSMLFEQQSQEAGGFEEAWERSIKRDKKQPNGQKVTAMSGNLVKDLVQLAQMLEIPPPSFLTMAAQLKLDNPPDELRLGLQSLSNILGITLKEAALMVSREPRILSWSSAQMPIVVGDQLLSDRSTGQCEPGPAVDEAEPVVGEEAKGKLRTVTKRRTSRVRQQQDQLQLPSSTGAFFGTGLSDAKQLLYSSLGLSEADAIQVLTQVPELLIRPRAALSKRLQLLQDLLQLHTAALGEVVVAVPQLLLEPEAKLQQRLKDLSSVFRILAPSQLAELVSREPQLMALPAAALSRRYRALGGQLGLFEDDMLDIVLADPSVLTQTIDYDD